MSNRKFMVGVLVVFATYELLEFFVHLVILREVYEQHDQLWRSDMTQTTWIFMLTALVQSLFFVYFFSIGFENKGIREGIRYGFLFGLMMSFVGIFNQYGMYPVPLWLAWQWFAYGLIQFMLCGIALSMVMQGGKRTTG